MDDGKIMSVVFKHRKWIDKKIKEVLSQEQKFVRKEFVNGESFLYLGRYYKLTIVDNQREPIRFENGFYLSKIYFPLARDVLTAWYKREAFEKITQRVELYAKIMDFKYNKVNITNAQKRWGSCSGSNLNFSWRLIMAPLSVIDYVVIHELLHLEEKNHSKNFWTKVRILMPDYEKHHQWLKENSYLLI